MQKEFSKCRNKTEELIKKISIEDMNIQTEIFTSPTKWHLAHTTWFFEKFILEKKIKNYKFHNQLYNYLFNSYYNSAGSQFPRDKRGYLSRPSVEEILKYRSVITKRIYDFLDKKVLTDGEKFMLELGINHEQQHQELILTDILNVYFNNPLRPSYNNKKKNKYLKTKSNKINREEWLEIDSSKVSIGNEANSFCFDNELPKHSKSLKSFRIKKTLVTNNDFKSFIDDDGYKRPEFWLSDGFDYITKNRINKPLYWIDNNFQFTLNGVEQLNDFDPVCHISFFEADAFAMWKKKRMPTEFEIEFLLKKQKLEGNFMENNNFGAINTHSDSNEMDQLYGNVWEWSSSNYVGYDNFKKWDDSIGEYNGKFMCNQFVLKGGSALTPKSHIRASYRNFFYPLDRWQLSGFRLAENIND